MKFLKNNLKVIIVFIICVILASSITVYAYSYFAKDIIYTKPGETQAISVETALNELYNKLSKREFTVLDSDRTGFSIPENTRLAYVVVCRGTSNIPYTATVSGNIITNQELISSTYKADVNLACYISIYKLTLSGSSGTISVTASGGNAAGQAWNAFLMY